MDKKHIAYDELKAKIAKLEANIQNANPLIAAAAAG
jgi:hypothetical protein